MTETTSAFTRSAEQLDEPERTRLLAAYDAWNSITKDDADQRATFLKRLDIQHSPGLIVEELNHGLEHTANLTFLSTLRQWAETKIVDRLRSPTYPQALNGESQAAVSRFHSNLTDDEQALVLRAFAIEMMDAFGDMLENGADDFGCPIDWVLANPSTGNQVAGSLHATFDGDPTTDDTYLPRTHALKQGK